MPLIMALILDLLFSIIQNRLGSAFLDLLGVPPGQ